MGILRPAFIRITRLVPILFTVGFAAACQPESPAPDASDEQAAQLERSPAPWQSETLMPGVSWHRSLGEDPRYGSSQAYHAVELDLPEAEVEIEFLWFFDRTALASMIANQVGAVAAINATYLGVDDQYFKNRGTVYQRIDAAEEDPRRWSYEGALYYDEQGRFGITSGSPESYDRMDRPGIISAGPLLVENHRLSGVSPPERPSHEHDRHPRTAVGVADGGDRLFLVTIDGRAQQAAGLTTPELTTLLREDFSVEGALNLDGGGTTMMWIAGETESGVVNRPSDNGRFDHGGERWTGQAIAVLPSDPNAHLESLVAREESCVARFSGAANDGSDSYLYLGDQLNGVMDMPAGEPFTLSLWVRPQPDEAEVMTLLSKRIRESESSGNRRGYDLQINSDGYPNVWFDSGEESLRLVADRQLESENWNHVAVRFNGETATLWLNGEETARAEQEWLAGGFDNRFFLAAGARRTWAIDDHRERTHPHSPWGTPKFHFREDPFRGDLDQIQIWHRPLETREIRRLAGGRLLEDDPESVDVSSGSLVSDWRLNEPSGSFARDRTGRVHGTYMGSVGRQCR